MPLDSNFIFEVYDYSEERMFFWTSRNNHALVDKVFEESD